MQAELFVAVLAGETGVGAFCEALGTEPQGKLPAKQDDEGHGQKAPGVGVGDEEQGGEHHGEVPVVDTAGGTAAVLHEPHLEGAEEQDADHVADTVKEADQQENAHVDDMGEVQDPDDTRATVTVPLRAGRFG